MSEYRRTLKGVKQNLEDIDKLEQKGLKSAVDRNKLRKEQLQFESRGLDIERKVDAIQDSILSKLAKQKGFEWIDIRFKGQAFLNKRLGPIVREILKSKLKIRRIQKIDTTPHGGCRLRRSRRM